MDSRILYVFLHLKDRISELLIFSSAKSPRIFVANGKKVGMCSVERLHETFEIILAWILEQDLL